MHIGYVRVSAVDQNAVRQLDGLALDKTSSDKASGKDIRRPQLELLLSYIREKDTPGLEGKKVGERSEIGQYARSSQRR